MKILVLVIATMLLIGCGNSKNVAADATDKQEQKTNIPDAKAAILSQDIAKFANSESYSITDISLQDNVLQIDITYSGGCEEHTFDLVGSAFIMKSSPPKRIMRLYHHENTDSCRELISETLYFDITNQSYHKGEIILQLEHFKEKTVRYTKVNK